jgi:O-antigen ligase
MKMQNHFWVNKEQLVALKQNRAQFIFISVLFVFLPFVSCSTTMDPETVPRFLIIAALLFVYSLFYSLKWLNSSGLIVTHGNGHVPIVLCAVLYILSALLALYKSQNIGDGIFDLLKIIFPIILTYYFTIFLRGNTVVFKYCIISLSISAILFNTFAGLQIADLIIYSPEELPNLRIGYYISSTLANKDIYCEVVFLCLPFSLYGMLYLSNWQRFLCGISFLSCVIALIMFITIYVYVAVIICLMACVGIVFIYRKRIDKRVVTYINIAAFALLLVFGVLILYLSVKQNNGGQGYLTTNKVIKLREYLMHCASMQEKNITIDNNNIHERIALIKNTTNMIYERPFTGFGLANWKVFTPDYGAVSFSAFTRLQNPHNDFLWIWAEMGLSGFLSYLFLLFFLLRAALKILIHADTSQEKLLGLLIFGGLLGFVIFSCFSFPKERIFSMIILAMYSAIILSRLPESSKPFRQLPIRPIIATFFIMSTLLGLITGIARLNGELHLQRAIKYQLQKRWTEMQEQTIAAESVFFKLDGFATPVSWYQGLACYYSGDTLQAMPHFLNAEHVNPFHLQVLNDIGACYEKKGQHTKAINYFTRAFKIFPINTLQNLLAATYNAKQYKKAYDLAYEHGLPNSDFLYQIILPTAQQIAEMQPDSLLKNKLQILVMNKDSLIDIFNIARMSEETLNTALMKKITK